MIKIEIFTDENNTHQCRIFIDNKLDSGFARKDLCEFKEYLNKAIDTIYRPRLKVINIKSIEICSCPNCGLTHRVDELKEIGRCYQCGINLEV